MLHAPARLPISGKIMSGAGAEFGDGVNLVQIDEVGLNELWQIIGFSARAEDKNHRDNGRNERSSEDNPFFIHISTLSKKNLSLLYHRILPFLPASKLLAV